MVESRQQVSLNAAEDGNASLRQRAIDLMVPALRFAAVAVAIGGMGSLASGVDPENLTSPSNPRGHEVCPAPSIHSVRAVEALIKQPRDQAAVARLKRHDLRLSSRLQDPIEIDAHGPTRQFLGQANRILHPYHVTISLSPNQKQSSDGVRSEKGSRKPFTRLDDTGRYDVMNIIRGINHLPTEYVHYSGLKKVVLYRNKKDKDTQAFVDTTREPQKVYYNTAYKGEDSDMAHEIEHEVDRKECGSDSAMGNDPAFVVLNHANIYTGKKDNSSSLALRDGLFSLRFAEYIGFQQRAVDSRSHKKYATLIKKKQKLLDNVTVLTDYSLKNSVEDKAELGSVFHSPNEFAEALNPATPKLRAKFVFLLARLYDKSPVSVQQLLATAVRPKNNGYFANRDTYKKDVARAKVQEKRNRENFNRFFGIR